MSKIMCICLRDSTAPAPSADDLIGLGQRLAPDNAPTRTPRLITAPGILCAVFNPSRVLAVHGTSVCMGGMVEASGEWWRPGGEIPDGAFALFRSDAAALEIVTDHVGSRTVWYYQDGERFIAATSQRAIVAMLGSFAPNTEVYPWVLSSGTLGPGLSWDRRITSLSPNSTLTLNRRSWRTRISRSPLHFLPRKCARDEHERRLESVLVETFSELRFDSKEWALPLSGGYDSRAIALLLKQARDMATVTWGGPGALRDRKGDAVIARRLAEAVGFRHEFQEIKPWPEQAETIVRRFLLAGEGRVDHISGYVDGFALWRELGLRYSGVIRGDEAFGCKRARDATEVLNNMKLTTLRSFAGLAGFAEHFDIPQSIPPQLRRHGDESLAAWRDRVYMQFEIPFVFAALNDLKLWYVEVASPLLSRRIQRVVSELPDHLRTDKRLFRRIVERLSPPVEFARKRAVLTKSAAVRHPSIAEFISERVSGSWLTELLPKGAAGAIAKALRQRPTRPSVPRYVLAKLGRRQYTLDPWLLGFRTCMIGEMNDLLCNDAEALQKPPLFDHDRVGGLSG